MHTLAITMGDAAGIGPEVILKALASPLPDNARAIVYGQMDVLLATEAVLVASKTPYKPMAHRLVCIEHPSDPLPDDAVGVIDVMPSMIVDQVGFGQAQAPFALLQLRALELAMDHAESRDVSAITTAPWTKHLFRLINKPAFGHTEVLAHRFEAPHHVMMLAGSRLRVALATVHVPINEVSQHLTHDRIVQTIETTLLDLGNFYGIDHPRVAVCGLNPHAGEHGVMGTEEADSITPAINTVQERWPHVVVDGPFASDTLFAKFRHDAPYDAVICMYHDQGLIPLKLLHFGQSANLTLGLPIIRTSVDHGTAYDIAGEGIADSGSMRYAMELALTLATTKQGR